MTGAKSDVVEIVIVRAAVWPDGRTVKPGEVVEAPAEFARRLVERGHADYARRNLAEPEESLK